MEKERISVMDIHRGDDDTVIPPFDPSIPEDIERVKRQIKPYLDDGWRLTAKKFGESSFKMIQADDITDPQIDEILMVRGAERVIRPALSQG